MPNDPQYPRQWHYPLINLPQSWDVTTGSNTVIVAVIDTGVLLNHPDLENRLTSDGYDFISDPERALDGDGIDPTPMIPATEARVAVPFTAPMCPASLQPKPTMTPAYPALPGLPGSCRCGPSPGGRNRI